MQAFLTGQDDRSFISNASNYSPEIHKSQLLNKVNNISNGVSIKHTTLRITPYPPDRVSSRAGSLKDKSNDIPSDYLFEPESSKLLNLIIPRYLEVIFYRTLLEAYASEHSARMIAMRNASKNASEVIKEMTLTFNKARQAGITRELLDIIGGAEGLK